MNKNTLNKIKIVINILYILLFIMSLAANGNTRDKNTIIFLNDKNYPLS